MLDVFTPVYGRLMLIAKGARRKKSRTKAVLMPFRPLLLSWSGKGQLPILTAAEQTGLVAELRGEALACGYYMNELILKLLYRFDPHEGLYAVYDETVGLLSRSDRQREALRRFEQRLLSEIGFGLVLDREVETGQPIEADAHYRYLLERGPVKIDRTAQNGADGQGDDRPTDDGHGEAEQEELIVSGDVLQALRSGSFANGACLNAARKLTQAAIERQLLRKKISSRSVMRRIRDYLAPRPPPD